MTLVRGLWKIIKNWFRLEYLRKGLIHNFHLGEGLKYFLRSEKKGGPKELLWKLFASAPPPLQVFLNRPKCEHQLFHIQGDKVPFNMWPIISKCTLKVSKDHIEIKWQNTIKRIRKNVVQYLPKYLFNFHKQGINLKLRISFSKSSWNLYFVRGTLKVPFDLMGHILGVPFNIIISFEKSKNKTVDKLCHAVHKITTKWQNWKTCCKSSF